MRRQEVIKSPRMLKRSSPPPLIWLAETNFRPPIMATETIGIEANSRRRNNIAFITASTCNNSASSGARSSPRPMRARFERPFSIAKTLLYDPSVSRPVDRSCFLLMRDYAQSSRPLAKMRKQNNCVRALLPAPIAIFAFFEKTGLSPLTIGSLDRGIGSGRRSLHATVVQTGSNVRSREPANFQLRCVTMHNFSKCTPASCVAIPLLSSGLTYNLSMLKIGDRRGRHRGHKRFPRETNRLTYRPIHRGFINLRFSFTGALSRRSRGMKLSSNRFDEPKNGMFNNHSALITYASERLVRNDEKNR
jgi:hypothetical protein